MKRPQKQLSATRRGIQLIFLVCGLVLASWAPMVPYAKERLHVNDADLGLLLLLLGCGAIVTMPVAGIIIRKKGSRPVVFFTAIGVALLLPLLILANTVVLMGITLFAFGACVGTIDIAMNVQASHVQYLYGKHIMSSFHGLFSLGGLLGSLGLGFLMRAGLSPVMAAVSISVLLIIITIWQYSKLFNHDEEQAATPPAEENTDGTGKPISAWLNGSVLILGFICFIIFMAEGAMIDWSALFLREHKHLDAEFAGLGYAAFSLAMAFMRLFGDKIVERFKPQKVVMYGALLGAAGLSLAVFTTSVLTAVIGFILLGLGLANLVPIFFSDSARINGVPASNAITAVTTLGYAGQLAGPALLGFIAYHFSLPYTLGFTGVLLLVVCVIYRPRQA